MISSWLLLSRLPVGSSARSKHGSLASDSRDRDALALADRELAGAVAAAVRQPDFLDQPQGSLAALARRPRALEHGDLDVFERGERGHEIERLKDKADLVGAEVVDVELRQRLFPEIDLALGGPIEAAEQVQERALAAAAGTGDRDRF